MRTDQNNNLTKRVKTHTTNKTPTPAAKQQHQLHMIHQLLISYHQKPAVTINMIRTKTNDK